jgi:hypothetical protein
MEPAWRRDQAPLARRQSDPLEELEELAGAVRAVSAEPADDDA